MKNSTLAQRHADIDTRLKTALVSAIKKSNDASYLICNYVAGELGISGQTVQNHCKGEGKDGYLKEAILRILKLYPKKYAASAK